MSVIFYSKSTKKMLSQRRLETYDNYCKIIQWGRRHPVDFARRVFGLEMIDYQKYTIWQTWNAAFAVWLKSRNAGKTTDAAIYTMLRSTLFPGYVSYFISNVGAQAKETFLKMEHIAKKEIPTFTDCTDVFFNEVEKNINGGSGFVHDTASFHVKLFNGSEIFTLNSDPTNARGRRANMIYIDEAGWVSEELMVQVENFANQNENFKLGSSYNPLLEPKDFPRQIIYGSSASDTDSAFYRKLKEYTRQMIMGNSLYFVCDFDIDAVMAATVNGEALPEPLISQSKVDQANLLTPDKAQRELYNHFSQDTHEGQILTRRDIMQHTKQYLPCLSNTDGTNMYLMSWDSARLNDNSVVEVAEIINDPEIGWRMRLVNVNSLVDIKTKNKTPMRLPDQVNEFKKMLLAYNGTEKGKLDYENIMAVIGDAGAGGQLIGGVSDYLLEPWRGADGKMHKGLIDRRHKANETAKEKYPDAVDIMHLVDPRANRNLIFQAIEDMVKLGVVEFPTDYDVSKDYIIFTDEEGVETRYDLSVEQQISLANFDLLKTEIVTMCKYVTQGNITYNFPPDKRNKMHDDRVFAFGLLCWYLAQLRRGQVINKPREISIEEIPTTATAVEF